MVEQLIVFCGVYTSATQWRAACNNQSETSVAGACAADRLLRCLHIGDAVARCLQQPIRDVRRWRMRCGL